jgi:hypothetical protein
VRKVVTRHELPRNGAHILKFWMIDPGVVLERIVVDFGGMRPSYLGPLESARFTGFTPSAGPSIPADQPSPRRGRPDTDTHGIPGAARQQR